MAIDKMEVICLYKDESSPCWNIVDLPIGRNIPKYIPEGAKYIEFYIKGKYRLIWREDLKKYDTGRYP